MFNPNDIFVSILGHERLEYLGINLDLYSNFYFRDELHINIVYNGQRDLTSLEGGYDSLNVLPENRGYYAGALDGINASLVDFIESDRNVGVIHNFDYLFFYDNPFKRLIDDFIKANKGVLMWKMKNVHPPERVIIQTDCFVITKEFAAQIYPIVPNYDITLLYRKALAKIADGSMDIMEEWFFQRLVNVIMPENLAELNNTDRWPENLHVQAAGQHADVMLYGDQLSKDHNFIMDILSQYCFFITGESRDVMKQLERGEGVRIMSPPENLDRGVYDSRYHSIHTHHYEILKPLLTMFKYNLNNKKFKFIDKFINNKI